MIKLGVWFKLELMAYNRLIEVDKVKHEAASTGDRRRHAKYRMASDECSA